MAVVLEWRQVGQTIVIDLAGRLSITDGNILRQTTRRLMIEGHRRFVLNLSQLETMDSSGIGQLVSTFSAVKTQGGDVKLVNPTMKVREALKMTMLDRIFHIFLSEPEALHSLEAAAP